MELWIRTQTKTGLYKIDNVYIDEDEDKTIHIWTDGINKYLKYYLGSYETKERALEVLDEIQNILQPKPLVIVRPSEEMVELLGSRQAGKTMKMKQDFEFKELSTYVYQMPEE